MKRILIFSLAYYPFVGGDGVAVREITNRISPSDIEFDMVTLRFDSALPKIEKIGNVTVHRIGRGSHNPSAKVMQSRKYRFVKLWFQFAAAWYAIRLHRKSHYDAVWAMMAHSAGVPAALFKTFYPSVPYILTLQEGDPPEYVEKVMRPLWLLFARAFKKADAVQAISTFLGRWARRRGFTGPLEVIPNGVDIENFSREFSEERLHELKAKLGKKDGDVYLITTSRLVHKNAIDDVIRALPSLPTNIQFLILGIGSEEEALRTLTIELSVSDRVKFLGQISHLDLPRYLKISDIFVRPSRSEGMGNSFIEAMAAGLPVIATQEGGIEDFLFDAKKNPDKPTTGWAVAKDSPEEIAQAVTDVLSNPTGVKKVIESAHSLVINQYDWARITQLMREKVFSSIL